MQTRKRKFDVQASYSQWRIDSKRKKLKGKKKQDKKNKKKPSEKQKKEILEKNREYSKAYRQKRKEDPVRYEQYREYEKHRYEQKKAEKVPLSARDLREKQKRHRESCRKYKLNKKLLQSENNSDLALETVVLDEEIVLGEPEEQPRQKKKSIVQVRKAASAKRRRMCYKTNTDLRRENDQLKIKVKTKQKTITRLKTKIHKVANPPPSPISNVRQILENLKLPQDMQDSLISGQVLKKQLAQSYKTIKSNKHRNFFKAVTGGAIIKKYRLLSEVHKTVAPILKKKRKVICKNKNMKEKINQFFLSSCSFDPAKKGYVVANQAKLSKQYLPGSMLDLYDRFCREENIKISYKTFTMHRPVQCVAPKMSARNTCACIVHENFNLLVKSLHQNKIIHEKTDYQVTSAVTCYDKRTEKCFARECENCKNIEVFLNVRSYEENISFQKWSRKKELRISEKTNQPITVTITLKELKTIPVSDLEQYFVKELKLYMSHVFNVIHQDNFIKNVKTSLGEDECLFFADFSENYSCKYASEVHACHFGASKTQITLHTGYFYAKNFHQGFATFSPSLRHDAAAAFAHLQEIFKCFQEVLARKKKLYIVTDGPTSQYRNKTFFYLVSQLLPKLLPHVTCIIHNYTEVGHGKGPHDAIGGATKNALDEAVKYGSDLANFDMVVTCAKEKMKKVLVSTVQLKDIQNIDSFLQKPEDIPGFLGTTRTHQYIWIKEEPSILKFNSLSCDECEPNTTCVHYSLGCLNYEKTEIKSKEKCKNKKAIKRQSTSSLLKDKPAKIQKKKEVKKIENSKLKVNKSDVLLTKKKKQAAKHVKDEVGNLCSTETRRTSVRQKKSTFTQDYQY